MVSKIKLGAVITGDIVESSSMSLPEKDNILQKIKHLTDEYMFVHRKSTNIQIYRGDSFQISKDSSSQMLGLSILIRAYLKSKGYDVRQSIAAGVIERLPTSSKQAEGEALVLSGHGLEQLEDTNKRTNIQFGAKSFDLKDEKIRMLYEGIQEEVGLLASFLDDIIKGWTQRQATAIYWNILLNYAPLSQATQNDIAIEMKTTQQSISKLLNAAKWNLIAQINRRYSSLSTLFDQQKYSAN